METQCSTCSTINMRNQTTYYPVTIDLHRTLSYHFILKMYQAKRAGGRQYRKQLVSK